MPVLKNYLSLIKFSHTVFAMPFAMIGFFIGVRDWENLSTKPANYFQQLFDYLSRHWYIFLLVLLCMIFARSAAMAFNRYLDRWFDAQNPRTAIREIPSGIIKANDALAFTIICSLLFMGCCFFINKICFYLSPIALLVVLGYSFTKRFTSLCHLVLGVGLSLAPIGAYLAVTGSFDMLPILFSLCVICWVSGFDIIYALQDEDFDKSQNLNSIPVLLGKVGALRVSRGLHILSFIFLAIAFKVGGFGVAYGIGLAIFAAMLIYQHRLVKPTDLSKVNLAFMATNGFASIAFGIMVLIDIFMH